MKDPLEELLKVVRDETKTDKERSQAAYTGLLLTFAEPIDENTMRITKDTSEKVETYLSLLRLKEEMVK